jgi:hypothetical protein
MDGYLRETQPEMGYIGLSCSTFNGHLISSGQAVAKLVETLRYKLEGRGFDSFRASGGEVG